MSEPTCTLTTPLRELAWLPPQRVRQLERFDLATVGDVLTHYPRRHEDRSRFDRFPSEDSDQPVCVCGIVKKTQLRRFRGYQKMFDAILEEADAHALSEPLICRWFNAHWVEKALVQGQRLVVFGKAKRTKSGVIITHPEFEVVEDDTEVSVHLGRLAPVHRATEGLSPRVLRRIVWDVLQHVDPTSIETLLPPKLDPHSRAWALAQIHFPDNAGTLAQARRHLVLEEFFAMQLCVAAKRAEQQAQPGAAHCGPGELLRRLHAALPFPLTAAQLRTIGEIRADLASLRPMNRLLHGDVGSGKTLVALSAMLLAVESGCQAALMAPTQILAEQHYLNLRRLCDPLGLRIALRTGARKEESGLLPLFAAAAAGAAPGGTGGPPVASGGPPDAPLARSASREHASTSPKSTRYSRRSLPHFERPWAKYFITIRAIDHSILSPAARQTVLDCILHWKDRRYELFAACVMPDHLHLLIEPQIKENDAEGQAVFFPLSEILHTLKSFTAHEINRLEKRTGSVWQDERFDRYIRSEEDLIEKFNYIVENPWTAKLVGPDEDYPWVWHLERDGEKVRRQEQEVSEAGRFGPRASGPFHPSTNTPLDDSEPQILVGTHALLYEGAGFTRLGLAVIDEQHKFGVLQRAQLRAQGAAPDVLVMTATPIPRTLTMTLYGDLDVSTLDEMPAGRGKIVTAVRETTKLPDAVKFMRTHLDAGRQAYIVYPLIDESEKLEAKAAAGEFAKWQKLLEPMRCELLHGRIVPEEKEAIMERFRRGETKVLIATTVIEVGIDVPNANLMLIENAERFGLAQLHQLRGRIGRGEHTSYCILLTGPKAEDEAKTKLNILAETSDGFAIAEADLRIRGPGDILGTAQSGLPPLKLGDVFADADLMKLARNHAFLICERDPQLTQPAHAPFRQLLASTRKVALAQVS